MLSKKLQIQFLVSLALFVACLLLIRLSDDVYLAEVCKAAALFGSLYMFRIISHHSNPVKR